MKALLCGVLLAGFVVSTIGCEAEVKPTHDDSSSSTYDQKKTTVTHPDGSTDTTVQKSSNN